MSWRRSQLPSHPPPGLAPPSRTKQRTKHCGTCVVQGNGVRGGAGRGGALLCHVSCHVLSVVYNTFRLFTNERVALSAASTGGAPHLNGIFEEFKQMQSRPDVNMSEPEIGLMQGWSLVKLEPAAEAKSGCYSGRVIREVSPMRISA